MSDSSSPKPRSPRYPAFDLEAAVAKVATVFKMSHRHAVSPAAIKKALNLSATSSSGIQTIATLRAFGLLEHHDSGLKVSDPALAIIIGSPSSANRQRALRDCALLPPVHAKLWAKFNVPLPGDTPIVEFLRYDLGFMEAASKSVIQQYRRTLAFAGLDSGDSDGDNVAASETTESETMTATEAPPVHKPTPQVAGTKRDVFSLGGQSGEIIVQWPERLNDSDLTEVEEYWPILLRKIKRSLPAPGGQVGE